ncbi:hypothetical protein PV08_01668 [Exophiala spinifera]|uniref:Methyltransferase domain-containing protein n=1 Tax=Exophiala spinifera TaxID=91928 RepID=A0A0D2CC84_9EURO|nr:uncharacterized protein PV08_01668 [Exophiala spinifera]KIW21089.1 hypothetical protein PV08_01668 [Exophiala spinifera]
MEQDQIPSQKPGHPPVQSALLETRTAENSAAHLLPKLQSMKESKPGLRLLDVGAGPGTISVGFAKLLPDGHVTGIDVNPRVLPRARAVAEIAGVTNIEFQEGSVHKLPFADETFDVTYCHQVLTHVGNPWDALREMLRVTKRGGVVAAREGDYETECVWPDVPELSKTHSLIAALMRAGGGTSTAGRQLLSWALRAGIERSRITVSSSTWLYATPSDRRIWAQGMCDPLRKGSLRDKALQSGLATEDNFEDMAKAWEAWAEIEDATMAMMHGEILVQK